ncbi:uncharacterized protein LOC124112656 [Haliotis rufescens]|uniref:uncharacterized protein LOC124112656 n=1 Tax=Haliotis rufescens TaxID=6454 RepID=UPI00201EDB04|nr:uncharacterized protein LOC124112656 [Haliotis rufescens]
MKVLFILSAVLLATAQANFLTTIGQNLSNVFKTLGQSIMHQLDTTGVDLLNAGLTAGKTLISQGVQALALNTANAIGSSGTRDIQLPTVLQNMESSLHNVVDTLMGEMKNMFGFLVKGLQGVVDKLSTLEITPEEVISEVDKFVNAHNLVADSFLKTIKDKAEEVISSLIKSKRNGFTDFFAGIGQSLSNTFKPMVDGVKTLATVAGSAIKNGATNLLQKAKDSVTQLGQKLQPHIANLGSQLGTLVMHGSNALNAMKAAGGDILQQTLTNMKEPLNNIGQTVVNAGQTVVGHVAGALLGTNTNTETTLAP